jgi:putative hydrolase of the HAD superfamily
MIKLILFDWGDVCGLCNLELFNTLLKKEGYSAEVAKKHFDELKPMFDRAAVSEEEYWRKLAEKLKFRGNWQVLAQSNQKILTVNWPLMDYIKELKKKARIALLSNADKTSIARIKSEINLADYFEKAYFSSEWLTGKLEKRVINKILQDFNVQPQEIIFIDDFPGNIEKAKAAGMQTILFVNLDDLKSQLDKLV